MMARTRKRTKTARQMTRMKIGLDSSPPIGAIVSGKKKDKQLVSIVEALALLKLSLGH